MASEINKPITVLVADDSDFLRLGIKAALEEEGVLQVVAEAKDGKDAVEKFKAIQSDVVVMDISMPVINGIEATRQIKQINPACKIVMVSSHEGEEEIFAALSAGASGYCLKDTDLDNLRSAVQAVYLGDLWFDSQIGYKVVKLCRRESKEESRKKREQTELVRIEQEMMQLLSKGCSTKAIAGRLNVPFSAAKACMIKILNKATANETIYTEQLDMSSNGLIDIYDRCKLEANYELLSKVSGAEATSTAFKAKDRAGGQIVFINLFNRESLQDAAIQDDFFKRAQLISELSHANIVCLRDYGITKDHLLYLVSEYIDGPTLAQLLERGGRLAEFEAIGLFLQLASALCHVHSRGIVHGNIKPSSILLSCENPHGIKAKLTDFALLPWRKDSLTPDEQDSVIYMSPEQCRRKSRDERSDVYSFGCVMFEVLEGAPPFRGQSAQDIINMHLTKPVPSLDKSQASSALSRMVCRCLSKDPCDRFVSVSEIMKQLEALERTDPGVSHNINDDTTI